MAEQEDQPDTNSLEPSSFGSIRSLDLLILGLELTEEVAHDRSEMSALQPPDALESQSEDIHLRHGRIHSRS